MQATVGKLYYSANHQRILIIANKLSRTAKLHNKYLSIESPTPEDEQEYLSGLEKWKLNPDEDRFWAWLAEHHPGLKDEFSSRSEITGRDGEDLIPKDLQTPKALETAVRAIEFMLKKKDKTEPEV
jgi:hypothetical protein